MWRPYQNEGREVGREHLHSSLRDEDVVDKLAARKQLREVPPLAHCHVLDRRISGLDSIYGYPEGGQKFALASATVVSQGTGSTTPCQPTETAGGSDPPSLNAIV